MNLSLDWVGLAVAGVLVIVWLVRLEGRVNQKADASAVQAVDAKADAGSASATAGIDAVRASTVAAVENIRASVDGTKTDIHVLQQAAKKSEETKIEVVRLQEQIKHLTNLIEKWFQPPPQAVTQRRRRTTTVEEG